MTTPGATPFARWTFHRAWWDAYASTAHEQYLVCLPDQAAHRHEAEPDDTLTATVFRRQTRDGTPVRPDAKAIFFGASYHADYATVLAAAEDVEVVAHAVVSSLARSPATTQGEQPWDVVDLRRLRADNAALGALEDAFRVRAPEANWTVIREREDVCPIVTAPDGGWDEYMGTLDKKARHEIRRKLRRARAVGELRVVLGAPSPEDVDAFIALHQRRFGAEGLFPQNEGGRRSRQFVHRLAELESATPDGGQLQPARVFCGERLIFAGMAFDDGHTCYLYNAGMDPDASELSPGISGTAEYLRNRIEAGRRRFDFLRGNEPYKYEWGAKDEEIERVLVLRDGEA
jgi:CelD/BcsL family acetyltransferase involved in cellulose biosynthesis